MSCQKSANQVCRAAVFSGVPANTAITGFAAGVLGAVWSGAMASTYRKDSPIVAAISTIGAVAGVVTAGISYRELQERKKVFTKHVLVDAGGNEIGWSYNPGTAKDKLKMYKGRGARLVAVQEKVDFAQVRKALTEENFQQVEKRA